MRTPDSCSGSVLEDGDRLDILRVHTEEFGELVFVGISVVEVFIHVVHPHVAVYDDKWVRITIDGADTTQTHGCTCTQVTRVLHDIKTCDTALQCFIDRSHSHTLELLHVDSLTSHRNLGYRNLQARALGLADCLDCHFLKRCAALEHDFAKGALVDREHKGLATDVRDSDFIFRTDNLEREVTLDISHSMGNDTVVVVDFDDVTHHQRVKIVPHLTTDNIARFHLCAERQRTAHEKH